MVHGLACIVATLGNSVCGDTIGFRTNIQQSLKSNNNENTWRYLNGKSNILLQNFFDIRQDFNNVPEIYIKSAPNNSNETHTFMCVLAETAVLGGTKTALKFKYEI